MFSRKKSFKKKRTNTFGPRRNTNSQSRSRGRERGRSRGRHSRKKRFGEKGDGLAINKPPNDSVGTPRDLYDQLDNEFHFDDFDPCPLDDSYSNVDQRIKGRPKDGLQMEWADRTFVNPPFSKIKPWLEKALEENKKGKTVVLLITARVSSAYWNQLVFPYAHEIRFIQGKVKFAGHAGSGLPIPIAIVVYRGRNHKNTTLSCGPYSYTSIISRKL
jgi:hypothetical protein